MTDPSQFNNPFWGGETTQEIAAHGPFLPARLNVSEAESFDDESNLEHEANYFGANTFTIRSASIRSPHGKASPAFQLERKGLGTVILRSRVQSALTFTVRPRSQNSKTFILEITRKQCKLYIKDPELDEKQVVDGYTFPKFAEYAYLNPSRKDPTVYWISIDRVNSRFRYEDVEWMSELEYVEIEHDQSKITNIDDVRLQVLPITVDRHPLVASPQSISLIDLAYYRRTTFANLPKLAQAIDQSCADVHKVCGKILKMKQEHNKTVNASEKQSYLRITIGDNLANSPGIPYVMEIWPPGHFSPIHDHGNASAVIKVLYGSIDCTWYDAVHEDRTPVTVASDNAKPIENRYPIGHAVKLSQGDVTWLGDNQYQIHKLHNRYKTVCITLQCYQFDDDKTAAPDYREYFTYTDDAQKQHKSHPTSDMDFVDLVKVLAAEWEIPSPIPV
ncbi:hypothetical protein PT974_09547 [Cladobotryum mycophilum]|uniref:Cysteine dioxygenase n=1 Tax=Cladobotryum mycophilum TaxID=491253 RepID=A0ABR0SGF2_9HYPO